MPDKIPRVLSNPLRRRVLRTVADHAEPIELDALGAETIMDAEKWEDHQIELYHIHLPKLADHGLIEWDQEDRTIEKGDQFEEARPLLDSLGPDESNGFSPMMGIMLTRALV
ncbi:helix-turn-helix domain-containing protein [Saliphagus infecundisoli]|uniref:Helix-turn-helix domain-containing protein n=1 Tax=Saliphagus infecundisoli TaxID=1849069 RepID=A0ABD5QJC2_9EURY|nr:helix-turn-helix domain-containing protein [Saliphagus infecundisoli]